MSQPSSTPALSLFALALSVGLLISVILGSEASALIAAVHVLVLALAIWSRAPAPAPSTREVRWGDGSYELLDKLGEGGMGEVFRARHAELRRVVAIKQIKPLRKTSEERVRFKREARVLSSLSNPHTINVFDAGIQPDGTFYYVMELLDGLDLEKLISEKGPLPGPRVIHILRQATMSLSEAHKKGLVHRDLKPANLMVCRYGGEFDFVKVLDFGLVKGGAQEGESQDDITQGGDTPGTPAFLAPESLLGRDHVTHAVDIYALGALGFFLLTGRFLFDETTPLKMMQAQLNTPPPRASEYASSEVPQALDELLALCVKKSPSDRPKDADTLLAELESLSTLYPWTREAASAQWDEVPALRLAPFSQPPLPSDLGA